MTPCDKAVKARSNAYGHHTIVTTEGMDKVIVAVKGKVIHCRCPGCGATGTLVIHEDVTAEQWMAYAFYALAMDRAKLSGTWHNGTEATH